MFYVFMTLSKCMVVLRRRYRENSSCSGGGAAASGLNLISILKRDTALFVLCTELITALGYLHFNIQSQITLLTFTVLLPCVWLQCSTAPRPSSMHRSRQNHRGSSFVYARELIFEGELRNGWPQFRKGSFEQPWLIYIIPLQKKRGSFLWPRDPRQPRC